MMPLGLFDEWFWFAWWLEVYLEFSAEGYWEMQWYASTV